MGASGLTCGSKVAKYFLFFFNIIFWLVGAVILGIGIWVLVDQRALQLMHVASADSSDSLVRGAAITFIVIGVIVFVTGFLGCCGALKENACMLLTYAILVSGILFLQVIAGILGAVFKDKIIETLNTSMNKTVQIRYGNPQDNATTTAYDFVQKEFECCGALDGPSEWMTSDWYKHQPAAAADKKPVPDTCCPLVDVNAEIPVPKNITMCHLAAVANGTALPNRSKYVWVKGCEPALEDWIRGHAGLLIGIAFGLGAVQLITIVIACCLQCEVRNHGTLA